MMEDLGEFLGFLIVVFFGLAASKYFLKLVDDKYFITKDKKTKLYKIFSEVYSFVDKYHGLFGILAVIFVLLHFLVQIVYAQFSYTGLITAILMILQVSLGIYGNKATTSKWYKFHLLLPIFIILAFISHLIF
ncbi:hypothetical protein KHQ89_02430 [Mycoplasmatota bacterium]|nr:hypothetical protein KHQ89_02430 [Mycoplasmatota bacterium]